MDLRVRDSEGQYTPYPVTNALTCRGKGEGVEIGRTRRASVR